MTNNISTFKPISADNAISLYTKLLEARRLQLQPALGKAVFDLGVSRVDPELQKLVPAAALNSLATLGIRGERVFPVPAIITHSPPLIGYYRMLLGLSKKAFSQSQGLGYGAWVRAEETGVISPALIPSVPAFCTALITPLATLVEAMDTFSDRDLNDLTLLTLGPTLQGGRNNDIGYIAARKVFSVICQMVAPWATFTDRRLVRFTTSRGQFELMEGSDPDIRLDVGPAPQTRPILAIEIKGGTDLSNAHNRTGEAEKSHLKAMRAGYDHRWTLIVMGGVSRTQIRSQTPSSTEIFETQNVIDQQGADWDSFRAKLGEIIGEIIE